MAYQYVVGAVRWKRHAEGDLRSYRAPKGWDASAWSIDSHPLTGREFKTAQWWIMEEYKGVDHGNDE